MKSIVLLDAVESAVTPQLHALAEEHDVQITVCDSAWTAIEQLGRNPADLIIANLRDEQETGMELIAALQRQDSPPAVILWNERGPTLPATTSGEATRRCHQVGPLRLLTPEDSPAEIRQLLLRTLEASEMDSGRLTVLELLWLALFHRQSASLLLTLADGTDLAVAVHDGSILEVFGQEADGESALAAQGRTSVESLSSAPLRRVDRSTALALDADALLAHCLESSEASEASVTPPQGPATQPLRLIRGMAEADRGPLYPEDAPMEPKVSSTFDLPRPAEKAPESAPAEPAVDEAEAAMSFEECFHNAMRASLARDYPTALRLFRRAAEMKPGDGRVRFNLQRLEKTLSAKR